MNTPTFQTIIEFYFHLSFFFEYFYGLSDCRHCILLFVAPIIYETFENEKNDRPNKKYKFSHWCRKAYNKTQKFQYGIFLFCFFVSRWQGTAFHLYAR